MYRVPRDGDPLEEVVLGAARRRPAPASGRAATRRSSRSGRHDGLPLLTFTSPHGAEHVEHTRPADAYLAMLGAGLRESRGWAEHEVASYLASVLPEPPRSRGSARRGRAH